MKTLGQSLRELRKSRGLLIREVAAQLDIDPSLLSRIERGEKKATRAQVIHLSQILKVDPQKMLANYLSERVVYALRGEDVALLAILIAEKKINRLRREQMIESGSVIQKGNNVAVGKMFLIEDSIVPREDSIVGGDFNRDISVSEEDPSGRESSNVIKEDSRGDDERSNISALSLDCRENFGVMEDSRNRIGQGV